MNLVPNGDTYSVLDGPLLFASNVTTRVKFCPISGARSENIFVCPGLVALGRGFRCPLASRLEVRSFLADSSLEKVLILSWWLRLLVVYLLLLSFSLGSQVQALDLGSSPAAMQLLDTSENSEQTQCKPRKVVCAKN